MPAHDVRCDAEFPQYIATAATNGAVVIWNRERREGSKTGARTLCGRACDAGAHMHARALICTHARPRLTLMHTLTHARTRTPAHHNAMRRDTPQRNLRMARAWRAKRR